jgi:hypothetical protein
LLAGPIVITAQTVQPFPVASTASAENVVARARDKVQPNLLVATVPDHATAGGSSFIKRAVRGVLRFTKSLFSVFGEGGTSIRKVEPKSKDQGEVTIRSDATVYSPGFDGPEGYAKVFGNALPPKVADQGFAIKFEVDGKEVDQEFRVLLYVDNKVIEPRRVGSRFIVPPELKDNEKVHVRFLSGKYDLSFDPVYAPKFETDWVVGIDNAPFDSENVDSENPDPAGKRLLVIWYLDSVPKEGDGTRLVVKVYK